MVHEAIVPEVVYGVLAGAQRTAIKILPKFLRKLLLSNLNE
jgi:hypothetical protein